jgi:protein TonB
MDMSWLTGFARGDSCHAALHRLFCNKSGCKRKGCAPPVMRIEICVALLASAALHAGLLFVAPGSLAPRDPAASASAATPVITARLKNTLDADTAARPERLNPARAARAASAQRVSAARSARPGDAARRQMRIDNSLRFYPPEAVAMGLEGEAILMLRIGADGALIDAQIARSSGHAILDAAALRAIRAAPRFGAGAREMLFPVTFALH